MYDAQDVADEVGIGNSTVRLWARQFEIPRERKGTKWVYSTEAMELFKTIKSMRENEHGMDTIRRSIVTSDEAVMTQQFPTLKVQRMESKNELLDDIEKVMERALAKNTELSEKYARATYKIGQQDERIRALEELNKQQVIQIAQLQNQIHLLPEVTENKQAIDKSEDSVESFEELESKLVKLEQENQELKQSSWSKLKNIFRF